MSRKEAYQEEYYVTACGQVKWGMRRNAGYKSGLDGIVKNESFKQFGGVYWFCRDIAIAICASGNEQCDVVTEGQKLVEERQLTQQELEHIYDQFGFNKDSYTPPDLEVQAKYIVEAIRNLERTE